MAPAEYSNDSLEYTSDEYQIELGQGENQAETAAESYQNSWSESNLFQLSKTDLSHYNKVNKDYVRFSFLLKWIITDHRLWLYSSSIDFWHLSILINIYFSTQREEVPCSSGNIQTKVYLTW